MIGRVALKVGFALAALALPAGPALAAPPDPATPDPVPPAPVPTVVGGEDPDGPAPLVPIPPGCPVPDRADVAFIGTAIGRDDIAQVIRYRIDQLRAGSGSPWSVNGLIDVRYGPDYRFIDDGEQYLVGAGFDPAFGALSSTVRPREPLFGGNDVVGVDDTETDCPDVEGGVRTVRPDGSSVDSGVLSLLTEDKRLLAATAGVPAAITFAVLIALVLLRKVWGAAVRGIFALGRAAVTPVPDHRAVRTRSHGPREYPAIRRRSAQRGAVADDEADADRAAGRAAGADPAPSGDVMQDLYFDDAAR